ncbi:nuclear transport factor 2 family protein [Daejeonella oryzae]|uniref:nuclear transport factor 2 family protein n=1 Tax=Daejeonella oryzae TaxID=1122943 RepID=UPI00047E488D|nr:nuclear transport factor 2 family protein [Daejeonella oryzae]
MTEREQMIRNYLDAYNRLEVDAMICDFDDDIVFENMEAGEITMSLSGLAAFKQQAEIAKTYFSERTQRIKSVKHLEHEIEIEVDYHAILAKDFPNGLTRGEELTLQGKSIFTFAGNKITRLRDMI